jgi:hypothetical protein
MPTKRICLWSNPRNISTAMMYSFMQRPDTIVFDEPLYAHYLQITGVYHPGNEEVLASQENDGQKVVDNIILAEYNQPIVFFKQMSHHLVALNENFLSKVVNILFIRDPKQLIASYAQIRPNVTMQDIGLQKQWQLFNQLNNQNLHPIVLDSGEILKDPEKVLRQLCDILEIPFYKEMLQWPEGPKKEDGVWAKHWYYNVHKSTGFEKQTTSERPLPEYLEHLYEESKKYYDELSIYSIKA